MDPVSFAQSHGAVLVGLATLAAITALTLWMTGRSDR